MNIKPRKKSGALTFCASFIPGAAEMYMGFFKSGISILLLFVISFIVPVVFILSDVFILVPMVVWLIAFFHARNIATCDDASFATVEDTYIWDEYMEDSFVKFKGTVARKWTAVAVILLGVSALWWEIAAILRDNLPDSVYRYIAPFVNEIPRVVIALAIIWVGVKLIQGKKVEEPEQMIEDKQK